LLFLKASADSSIEILYDIGIAEDGFIILALLNNRIFKEGWLLWLKDQLG